MGGGSARKYLSHHELLAGFKMTKEKRMGGIKDIKSTIFLLDNTFSVVYKKFFYQYFN